MASDRTYDQLVEYYDWEHRGFLADLSMYLGFAESRPGEILDAGCGTGRLLIPLAHGGHQVTGLDSSAEMLAVAGSKVRAEGLTRRVTLVRGDLRDFDAGRLFGVALVALGSFHHLLTLADQRMALGRLAAHVKEGGLLILDLINPSPEWLEAADEVVVHQMTAHFPDPESQDVVSKLVVRSGGFDRQTDKQLLIYDRVSPDGSVKRSIFDMVVRYLFRYEAEILITEAGLRVRDVYGGYDLEPYSTSSSRMIFVAEKI